MALGIHTSMCMQDSNGPRDKLAGTGGPSISINTDVNPQIQVDGTRLVNRVLVACLS
jgi:hypothetical protein